MRYDSYVTRARVRVRVRRVSFSGIGKLLVVKPTFKPIFFFVVLLVSIFDVHVHLCI